MSEDIKLTLVKYISGQADETEAAEIREWIRSSPGNEELFFQLYEAWHSSLATENSVDADAAFALFAAKTIHRKPLIQKISGWLRVAAAIILLPAIGLALFRQFESGKKQARMIVLRVPAGLPRKVSLPDGSLVWVNAGTEIRYSAEFGKVDRTIYLNGEAYFDIAKTSSGIPFLVKTDKYTIRDVGTVFNVKAYPDEDMFETAVMEGKVSVEGPLSESSSEDSKVFLDAHQVLKISNSTNSSKENTVKPELAGMIEPVKVLQINPSEIEEFNGWRNDLLIFEDDSFADIARILERRYNVSIHFASETLKNYKYTGTFKNVQDVENVLEIIKETTPIRYTISNHIVEVSQTN